MKAKTTLQYIIIFIATLFYLVFFAPSLNNLLNIPNSIFYIISSIIVFFYLHIILKLFFKSYDLSRIEILIIFTSYFTGLAYLLFFKNTQAIDASTLDFIPLFFQYPSMSEFVLLVGNVVLFIPIGYLYRNKNILSSIIFIIILALGIESLQFIFKVGVFDLSDALLYFIGFYFGYIYARLLHKHSIKKDNLSFDIMLVFTLIISMLLLLALINLLVFQ